MPMRFRDREKRPVTMVTGSIMAWLLIDTSNGGGQCQEELWLRMQVAA